MKNLYTLYSNSTIEDEISELLAKAFPKATFHVEEMENGKLIQWESNKGLFKGKINYRISMRHRNTNQALGSDDSPLAQNLLGLKGFISQIPAESVVGKENMEKRVDQLVSETAVLCSENGSDDLLEFTKDIALKSEGMFFCQTDQFIGQRNEPHFLNHQFDLLMDVNGKSDVFFPTGPVVDMSAREKVDLFPDQVERKRRNIESIQQLGIKTIEHLPFIESEEEVIIRSSEEIAARAVLLALTNFVAFGNIEPEKVREILQKYDLEAYLTPDEDAFLQNPTEELKAVMSWRCEGIWTLCWALGIVDDLGAANHLADLNKIAAGDYPVSANTDPRDFIQKKHKIRSAKEILDQCDYYYRLNWACVDARLNGEEMTKVHPGVVYERQYALNWLSNYMDQDWDNVSCDT